MSARQFQRENELWTAWVSGSGAYGTGVYSLGNVEAVHFAPADAGEVPMFEALIAAGTFEGLFDGELAHLLSTARRIVDPSELPNKPAARRRTLAS